ncbi:germination protein [Thalassobacillus devorans]|uniref:Germination protein n=1 Tax=Thalassobacillus devorans TaxID=279813 RepID=A0ABQ1PST5_9BACI|nr:GerAB/ArcD/ProY family transporter [Thalassobacillus devorans]NIK30672.1 spore germination protein (amino acid permease) [Thalassobacillus devorans]GGD02844.1 germination protein [Thalassobacillus devorans]
MANQKNQSKQKSQNDAAFLNTKITRLQFFFLIVQTQIGVGVISLPYNLQQVAKQDGWISLIGASLIVQLLLLLYWLLLKNTPKQHLFMSLEKIFGKWPGKAVTLLYCFYFIAVGALILMLYTRVINLWMLINTPKWILTTFMVTAGLYLISGNIKVLARAYTLFSGLMIILIVSLIYGVRNANFIFILPIGAAGLENILKGVNEGVLSLLGFVFILIIYPLVEGTDKEKLKIIFYTQWFILGFYLLVVFSTFTFFGAKEILLVPEPVLYMLKAYEFSVVERLDLFFISVWIVSVTTSFTTYLYMAGKGLKHMFNSNKEMHFMIMMAAISLTLALTFGRGEQLIGQYGDIVMKFGYLFSGLLPVLLLLIFLARKKKLTGSDSK